MIERMFPETVNNILDYDAIKAAAKVYIEDVFVKIVESFGNNLVLQTMDEAHLAEVAKNVTGSPATDIDTLLDYINTSNVYRECDFVNELAAAFPDGVEYKHYDVTGWQFPKADSVPFTDKVRSRTVHGEAAGHDEIWTDNVQNGNPLYNLLLSRYRGQLDEYPYNWHKKAGRRSSWGEPSTWMTTGGFGKPATIHINVDEERTVIEKNGLSAVENWLGLVSNKLPINLYIEITDIMRAEPSPNSVNGMAGSSDGYKMSFPYEEEEGFCTNDGAWEREVYYGFRDGEKYAFDNKGSEF